MELKKQGLSVDEIARQSAAIARGEQPTPAGIEKDVSKVFKHSDDHGEQKH